MKSRMRAKVFLANLFFILCCFPMWLKFYFYIRIFPKYQENILRRIINKNKNTKYGVKYNFSEINDYKNWRIKVPIVDYEDIQQYIKCENGLTSNYIKIYEPTSGSSGGQKLIPYTEDLRKEFQKGIKVWIFDLYIHNPELLFYKSYWSISPKTKTENPEIGFEKDEEYFSNLEQKFLKIIMVQPDLKGDFCKNTKEKLLKEKDNIGLISIWSPTFLGSVLNHEKIDFKNLKILSCWADSTSKIYAKQLCKQYPQSIIQPKGLLATEGITSFPLWNKGCVVSYLSHFYEFINQNGNVFLLNELEKEKEYTVVLTTSGGLYRYNTHDIVKVTGFYYKLPIIEFIGRDNNVLDFFGEKISESFVNNIFEKLFFEKPKFAVLGFNKDKYTLFIEGDCDAELLENALEQNYHYKNCIELGQLKPCTVKKIINGNEKFQQYYLSKGIKLGDIKTKSLDRNICDIFDV